MGGIAGTLQWIFSEHASTGGKEKEALIKKYIKWLSCVDTFLLHLFPNQQ